MFQLRAAEGEETALTIYSRGGNQNQENAWEGSCNEDDISYASSSLPWRNYAQNRMQLGSRDYRASLGLKESLRGSKEQLATGLHECTLSVPLAQKAAYREECHR